MSAAPTDEALLAALPHEAGGGSWRIVTRRPYRFATSAPLEELHVRAGDGADLELIFKDLARARLLPAASASKPSFLHQPLRELELYRGILAPCGIGPRLVAAVSQPEEDRQWLFIERVRGRELWQVGELEIWERVAAWLGDLHLGFAGRLSEVRALCPHLIDHSAAWFELWAQRARQALAGAADSRADGLTRALAGYDGVVTELAALPRTLVHGELYPSNVLVAPDGGGQRVCPVDWEMAGIGPGLLDLAALVGGWEASGWPESDRARLVRAYAEAAGAALAGSDLSADLARCRLHLALQWIGWADGWRPPPEHARDWLGEALGLAGELGLR